MSGAGVSSAALFTGFLTCLMLTHSIASTPYKCFELLSGRNGIEKHCFLSFLYMKNLLSNLMTVSICVYLTCLNWNRLVTFMLVSSWHCILLCALWRFIKRGSDQWSSSCSCLFVIIHNKWSVCCLSSLSQQKEASEELAVSRIWLLHVGPDADHSLAVVSTHMLLRDRRSVWNGRHGPKIIWYFRIFLFTCLG